MADPDYRGWAAAGISALQRWYDPSTGQWKSTSWWNAANALTAVIGYTRLTGDGTHAGVVAKTFTAARRQHPDLVNDVRSVRCPNVAALRRLSAWWRSAGDGRCAVILCRSAKNGQCSLTKVHAGNETAGGEISS